MAPRPAITTEYAHYWTCLVAGFVEFDDFADLVDLVDFIDVIDFVDRLNYLLACWLAGLLTS